MLIRRAIEARIDDLAGKSANKLEGIGGWLILIAIGIIVTPIRILMLIISTYSEIFTTGIWDMLTTEGSEAYNPLWAPIIVSELLLNSALVVAWVYMGYRFFTRKSDFPKLYIIIAVFGLVFIFADAFAIKLALPSQSVFDPETVKDVIRSLVVLVIWVPYILLSKRVKATFIRK